LSDEHKKTADELQADHRRCRRRCGERSRLGHKHQEKRMSMTRRSTLAGAVATAGIVLSAATAEAEPHPQIRRAINALERAKDYMQHAAHDFGGHRVEALRECDEAIRQLHEALRYDK
jgi:hypothetical protein